MEFWRHLIRRPKETKSQPSLTEAYGYTLGYKVPNQDSFFSTADKNIFGVFDGVGGKEGGAIASETARNFIQTALTNFSFANTTPEGIAAKLRQIFVDADRAVTRATPEGKTTATVAMVWEDKTGQKKLIVANIGDSRAYLKRGDVLEQLTHDDDILKAAFGDNPEAQQLRDKFNHITSLNELSEEPIRFLFPTPIWEGESSGNSPVFKVKKESTEKELFKNRFLVGQSLGDGQGFASIVIRGVMSGDILLLATDGVTDNSTTPNINGFLHGSAQQAAERVVTKSHAKSEEEKTNENFRPKKDDITAEVVIVL